MQAPLKDKNDIKIFILYLLKNLQYPLDFNTISDMVVQDEYVNYFDFAECFAELLDAGIIELIRADNGGITQSTIGKNGYPENKAELYRITENGVEVVEQLQSNLLNAIKEKSLKSAMRLLSFKARGSKVSCSGTDRGDGKYDFDCEIIENNCTMLKVKLMVESKELLEQMLENFDKKPEVAYRGLITLLAGDINYLID